MPVTLIWIPARLRVDVHPVSRDTRILLIKTHRSSPSKAHPVRAEGPSLPTAFVRNTQLGHKPIQSPKRRDGR